MAFTIGNLTADPGEKLSQDLFLNNGEFKLPATIIHGEQPGKTMLITAGVHSAEYVGIQAAIDLARAMDVKKVAGTVVILKVLNRPAFEQRKGSFGLSDEKNLNRVFPGDPDGTEMDRLAYAIVQEVFPAVDYYIDLHSGDDYEELTPYVYYAGVASEEVAAQSRQMAAWVDVPYMVRSGVASGGAYNYAASGKGIPSILIERGGMGAWTMEEARSTRRDVHNILCNLGIYQEEKDQRRYYPLDVVDVRYQCASHSGCWYPEKKAGDMISQGEYLGEVRNYEGHPEEGCWAEFDGVILYQAKSLQVIEDGPMITYGRISREFDSRKERITKYWGKRSDSFLEQKRSELHSPLAARWRETICSRLPQGRSLKILDVGCGAGFFTILLAKEGHALIGTDLTPEMQQHSVTLAKEEGADCQFLVMDAEALDFPDETFDVVISRNLTWTLPHAEQAYGEWVRVLKPGGMILNFDANYGLSNFADTSTLPKEHAHHTLGDTMMQECEDIKRQLPISTYNRPAWDISVLGQIGMREFALDLDMGKRIYVEKDEFYNPTPIFMISAKKGC